ncbi:50S ribosomal protein L15 [Thalassoglobus sp.]|uniref:50S ribosomal protein L15 n=1 Tax=Thalassoglobus sp. TaxID=2795869 RepID=UPI003AA7BCD8
MMINDVHQGITKNKNRKRVGRGVGSGHGKTCGRGHKGAGSRRGHSRRLGFAGGQMPLFRLVAKRGFNNNAFAKKVVAVNIGTLQKHFEDGSEVNPETLKRIGLAKGTYDFIKILGDGELSSKLVIKAHRFSKSALEKIEASGGTAEIIV